MLVAYLCLVVNVFALESLGNKFKDDYDYSTWKNPYDGGLGNLKSNEDSTWKNPFDGGLGNLKSDKDNTEKSDVANEMLVKVNKNEEDPYDEAKVPEMNQDLIIQLKDKTESSGHLKQCYVPKQSISNILYFKHFLSNFSRFVYPGGDFGDYYVTQIRISSHRYDQLQKLLDLENSDKELLEIMTESFEEFHHTVINHNSESTLKSILWYCLFIFLFGSTIMLWYEKCTGKDVLVEKKLKDILTKGISKESDVSNVEKDNIAAETSKDSDAENLENDAMNKNNKKLHCSLSVQEVASVYPDNINDKYFSFNDKNR